MAKADKKSRGQAPAPQSARASVYQETGDPLTRATKPAWRRLEIFAIDPSIDTSLANVAISRCVLPVRWESLEPGPIGEYIEVIDVDPSSQCVYDPVDLEDKHLVARDGLTPSEGSPQFHQQMVYAVAMKTIENFERAIGRPILWSERLYDADGTFKELTAEERYVSRLRIYPHALREANAFYSPLRKSLLFGYFNAATIDPRDELPGGTVFAALSHDIIAHETTHAILDGIHRRLLDPTNPDMLAFHEAFADIVAIFQHFTLPGLLLDQIERTKGDLALMDNFLSTLAIQFGKATLRGSALRNALGRFDASGNRIKADPAALSRTGEPHDRGAILVSAVFDAFLLIYESRVRDLRRIATGGSGILPAGDIHPDLARRFADEAAKAAQHVLTICIRALDYLPPVDVDFGDYLRALITADTVIVPDDPKRYRLAFIEAFRNHGIYPLDVRSLGEESLRWIPVTDEEWAELSQILPPREVLRTMANAWEVAEDVFSSSESAQRRRHSSAKEGHVTTSDALKQLSLQFLEDFWTKRVSGWGAEVSPDAPSDSSDRAYSLKSKDGRKAVFLLTRHFRIFFWNWLSELTRGYDRAILRSKLKPLSSILGLDFEAFADFLDASDEDRESLCGAIEVHTVRRTFRVQDNGRTTVELLILLTQWRWEDLLDENGRVVVTPSGDPVRFKFRGGTTLIIDPRLGRISFAITKNIGDPKWATNARLARVRRFLRDRLSSLGDAALDRYPLALDAADDQARGRRRNEPLALLHRETFSGDW